MKRLIVISLAAAALVSRGAWAQQGGTLNGSRELEPLRNVTNPGKPTTHQAITPAGVQTVVQARIYAVAFGKDSSEIWLTRDAPNCCVRSFIGDLIKMNWRENRVVTKFPLKGTPGIQGLVWDHERNRLLASVIGKGDKAAVSVLQVGNDGLVPVAAGFGAAFAGELAAAQSRIVVPMTSEDSLAVLQRDGTLEGKVPVGISPFAAVLNASGDIAWVSNWGGRIPRHGELSELLGASHSRAVVDARGVASSGTVQRVDLKTRQVTATIETGLQPTAMVWDEKRNRLYVANTNADSITVIDTFRSRALQSIPLNFFEGQTYGITPTAMALSPDGEKLWVTCSGINAVAQFAFAQHLRFEGLIPTASYPYTLAVSPDGRYLLVGTFFGVGEGSPDGTERRSVNYGRSTAHVIAVPEPDQLAEYTRVVAENTHLTLRGSAEAQNAAAAQKVVPLPVPLKAGDPSLIQYVVYIIKENWTYDSLFGADPRGNGDPSLQMFGHDVIPNHQNLARDFVLLDNFYSTGYSSQDGQSWMTQAFTTEYLLLPGYMGRGGAPMYGQDPLTFSESGFLWNAVTAGRNTARVYGEFTDAPVKQHPDWSYSDLLNYWKVGRDLSGEFRVAPYSKEMTSVTAPNYPGFYFDVPDVVRAQIFLHDLAQWSKTGGMPNFVFLELPLDHTEGNTPDHPTPKAYVAGNDLALGKIVEGLSHSKFWPHMAIFVAEDDGFNALDHVDGRRVAALAISPYIRRRSVDSTFYSQTSMVKTIELMLGVKPMTLYDRIAPDMRNAFTTTPDPTPYTAEIPQQSLAEVAPKANAVNGKERAAALASARMDFSRPDAAPLDKLSHIVWHCVRGWNTPFPKDQHAAFLPSDAGKNDADASEKADR